MEIGDIDVYIAMEMEMVRAVKFPDEASISDD